MKLLDLILSAIPLAMGVAVVVTTMLNSIDTASALTLLGLGTACSGLAQLRRFRQ